MKQMLSKLFVLLSLGVILASCGVQPEGPDVVDTTDNSVVQEESATESDTEVITDNSDATDAELIAQMTSYFDTDVLAEDISIQDCTLSAGTDSRCYAITVASTFTDADVGPFCPTNISDDDSKGGIWLKDGEAYDVDGEFISNLAEFYGDDNWLLYTQSGQINVTEGLEECEAAANPQVAEEYQNHCVECMLSYLEDFGETTYYIPVNPVDQDTPSSTSGDAMGLAFNGVKFEVSAPIENIISAYTIAPFDDCGGHVNPNVGYHYHAYQSDQDGCSIHFEVDDHSDFIGFALDGYQIYGQDDSVETDTCGGHTTDELGYHYHIDGDSNEHLGCATAEYACVDSDGIGTCDATESAAGGQGGPGGQAGGDRPAGGPPTR